MNTFTTKAKTLQSLRPVLTSAKVLPIVICTVGQLRQDPQALLDTLEREGLLRQRVIVRSSAQNEDTAQSSNAGKFLSIGNVQGKDAILTAAKQVAEGIGEDEENEIFI